MELESNDRCVTVNVNACCRICLSSKRPLCPLFKYKLSGNYAEMLTAVADVKVSVNDGLPEKICNKCCSTLEKAFLLKTIAERSDKRIRNMLQKLQSNVSTKKIAFDTITDIKSEIGPLSVKLEPHWEVEVDNFSKPVETMDGKDIIIADTIIRKVDVLNDLLKSEKVDEVDVTWTKSSRDTVEEEYLDDDVFQDDDDDDYVPPMPVVKSKKFKKPRLSEIKVFSQAKTKKQVVKKIKIIRKDRVDTNYDEKIYESSKPPNSSTTITCYPITKTGARGPPILLKRPKDATVLKIHPNYKTRSVTTSSEHNPKITRLDGDKPIRLLKTAKSMAKQREKLVCPVCGILTYTLGHHMATHDEKKKYSCPECTRSFVQRGNLHIHMKQHTGIKDHICEICGAGFYSQKSLVRHNLIHTGERPFSCNLCNKKFIARCDLNRHLRIHAGYKPYKCGTCTMSFNAKHQLQNHERIHTGERPYNCQLCNVAFSYKVNLNNHVLKVHGVNLKFKSIHTVTEDILRRELGLATEERLAIAHILPPHVPTPGAHETVQY